MRELAVRPVTRDAHRVSSRLSSNPLCVPPMAHRRPHPMLSLLPDSLRVFLARMMRPVTSRNGNEPRTRKRSRCEELAVLRVFMRSAGGGGDAP